MNAIDFKNKWITEEDKLESFDSGKIQELSIPAKTKEFLMVGLPVDAAPFLSFGPSHDANLQSATEEYELSGEFECYKIIGSNGYGDPVCINENDNSVVYLNHDDEFGYVYMNSSVEQLAHFLLIVRDFIEKVNSSPQAEMTKTFKDTIAEMIKSDETAMYEGTWEDDLRSFIE
jgi:uncharacterized protein YlbG (UPF0298 family)